MPVQAEVATIVINDKEYTDWESVHVESDWHSASRIAQFTTSEKLSSKATFAALQIKPGDKCEVSLAGQKVITGIVFGRQASFDANSHSVIISARGETGEIVNGSVPLKASQMRGYGFEQIARSLIKPFGINLKMVNVPAYASKPFKDLNFWPGESVFECLDRLAKLRGMTIRSDADGNLVVGGGSMTSVASFVEGQNIKSATCMVRDDTLKSVLQVVTQMRGDDNTPGETARKPSAIATGASAYHRPLIIHSEEPGDAEDMAHRADHENRWLLGKTIECNITVQGWLKPDGKLWDVEDCYTVTSPSLILDSKLLGSQTIVYSQDSQNGTMTSISMVRPEARNGPAGPVTAPAGSGDGSLFPGGTLSPAVPESI